MGLFDWLRGQFIDVIEWFDDSGDTIVYRFPRHENEIKYGAKLIVRPGQKAVFVNEGQIAEVLGPGTWELETKNLPILTDLQHWDHGFTSPFKAEVYFVSTKRFGDLKFGTKTPIIVNDPELGPVRLKAYGTYEIRITDPAKILRELSSTDGNFTTEEIEKFLGNLIIAKLPIVLAKSGISIFELAKHYDALGEKIKELLQPYFDEYGVSLEKILLQSISLPKDLQEALDAKGAQTILGDMNEYLKYKSAQGLEKGGSAADMVGLGAGLYAAKEMFEDKKITPSPLPQEYYYVAIENKLIGPLSKDALQKMIVLGEVKPDTLLWQEGMEQWQKAGEAVKDLFKKTPPPLDEN
ncbi:SPFH domain-containing protein [Nitratiruptor tergarcus]|uniref:Membrane protease subunit, stomatin/prohibitin family, contains C-terminal Zn-ribbon domain n=1 Tax=Nitratiruptor tergarcus DSM 16512 TaxID=1069081 RepID=A0A1W1WTQ8_9BACT|nr:SPFH domain-containing protein [Nitratiruptor tergarcus]SMC09430.1 Membrane protease subunit, stomatin/prohibitin family, contains C-terminal Zn-ribbon domain [Nitratiruptor tergarcus DSM 16512]